MKYKRICCSLLAIMLSLPLTVPLNSHAAERFSDTAGHWAEDYIDTAVREDIINGYPDGRFRPNKAVTRAEFASMVNKALGNSGTESISFSDVGRGDWYYNDVSKALAAAYTAGYDNNTFRPDNPITRQEAAVMISRIVPTYGAGGNLRTYPDRSQIADWAYESMEKVNGKGYLGSYNDGKIHPQDQLTRAQTAKIICEIIDHETIIEKNTVIDDDDTRLSGKIYSNNVTIDEDLGDESASIENCMILGTLSVQGGGTDSITVSNSRVASANVNRDEDTVRLIAKGETAIIRLSASKSSILQTSSLRGGLFGPGFSSISVNNSAEVSLRGNFPRVNVSGSKASVDLDSGTVDNLTVGGKYAGITVESGATVRTATVNAECYFHGNGTISQMNVNADDVTYETKPKKWTIAHSTDTPSRSNGTSGDIAFSPKDGANNVRRDMKITITFDSEMEMHDGDRITGSDIDNFIELRKDSSSGNLVDFSASINSRNKVITITPDSALSKNTKYYVIIEKDSIRDRDGDTNERESISFTTGDDGQSVTTAYSPANGASTVSVNPSITISFSENVVRYDNGTSISSNDSYLYNCISFRKGNSAGEKVSFRASIDSSKKVITLYPSSLSLNQKYYIAVLPNTLKTRDDNETVPFSSVTWATGYTTPVLSNFGVTPGDTTVTAAMTPNVSGRIYAVVIPSGSTAPSAAQIAVGQNSSGGPALGCSKNENAGASSPVTLPAMGGLGSGTAYDVWATLYSNASGTYSAPIKQSVTTTMPRIALNSLTVKPMMGFAPGDNEISFNPVTYSYSASFNSSVNGVEIKADGDSAALITMTGNGVGTIYGTGTLTAVADIAANPVLTVSIASPGKATSSYTINLLHANDTSLKMLKIDGKSQIPGGPGFSYTLATGGAVSVTLDVETNDKYAAVTTPIGAAVSISTVSNVLGSAKFILTFAEGSYPVAIEFNVISGGSASPAYTVTFTRP